jgi:hypothetical protein
LARIFVLNRANPGSWGRRRPEVYGDHQTLKQQLLRNALPDVGYVVDRGDR